MKASIAKAILLVLCISSFHLLWFHEARTEESGLKYGGFQWNGAIELGYRWTNISGNESQYKETVNLREGLKLFDFNLTGRNLDPGKGYVDYFSLKGREVGDPYPFARLDIRKNKTYDFSATYNQYNYYVTRDLEATPFLSSNLGFNSKFSVGTVGLSVFPKEDVRLNFGYRHWGRSGDAYTPRSQYFEMLPQDLDEGMNEYFISADFPIAGWNFSVKQSYWNYHNNNTITVPQFFEDRNENMNTLVTTVKAHTRFGERLDFDGAFVYAHSNGWSSLNTIPALGVQSGSGSLNYNTYVVELGLSYLITKQLILHGDYRFHYFDQNGETNTDPLLSPTGKTIPTAYNLTANTGTIQLEYLPLDNLTMRGGYQFQVQIINGEYFGYLSNPYFAGGSKPADTTEWTNGFVGSINWKPYRFLTVFGEYRGANTSDPYTWITPESTNVARVKVKYDTPFGLGLTGSYLWRRQVNPDLSYRLDVQDFTFTANYRPAFLPKISIDGSFTYEVNHNTQNIYNIVPGQFNRVVFDQNAIIWAGGITYENFIGGLCARVYGSYAKSYKQNSQHYADGVISAWYQNKYVTPILTFERTYLNNITLPGNSFSANLLTFSLRKEF